MSTSATSTIRFSTVITTRSGYSTTLRISINNTKTALLILIVILLKN